MSNFNDFLQEQLKDPEFKSEWDALEPEFELMRLLVEARREKGLTQKQLSEMTGISQADISRLESGEGNPSLKTIQRLATALDRKVQLVFV